MARDILGANGIADDYPVMRHMMNLGVSENIRRHARYSCADYRGKRDRHQRVLTANRVSRMDIAIFTFPRRRFSLSS